MAIPVAVLLVAYLSIANGAYVPNNGDTKMVGMLPSIADAKPLINAHYDMIERARQRRQSGTPCDSYLSDFPPECNISLIEPNVTQLARINAAALDLDHLTALNEAYENICIPRCIDPFISYYSCLRNYGLTSAQYEYLRTYTRQGLCGKHADGDFCEVKYLREYQDVNYINVFVRSCSSSGINCISSSSTCRNLIYEFNGRMGCCTRPYIGQVPGCNNIDGSCRSVLTNGGSNLHFSFLTIGVMLLLIFAM
jgi:hypothetical protein